MSTETSVLLLWLVLIQEGAAIRSVVTFTPNYKKIFTTESITMTCDVGSTIGEGRNYLWYKDNSHIYNGQFYTIQRAGTSHSGNYQCRTISGDISDPVRLDVSDGWVILQTPLYVYEGDKIRLRCHHYPGYFGRKMTFYKDKTIIRGWTDNAELYTGNVDRNSAGKYKCRKEVYHDGIYYQHNDEVSVSVQELFNTPNIKVTPHPVFKKENMTLTCETSLHPSRQKTQLRFAFYREGQIVQGSGVSDIYEVYIVQPEDSANYSCEVKTTDGGVRKRSAEQIINIEELFSHPYITVTKELYEGDPMTLSCNTTISPYINPTEVRFAFYRDGWTVKKFISSNEYEVQSAHLEDSGNYSCEVKSLMYSTMEISNKSHILVQELFSPPVLTVSPEMAIDGDNMTLSCGTNLSDHGQSTELQFAFYRDGRTVQGFNSSNKYHVQFIQKENSGTYTCEIQTSHSGVKKESQKLQIQGCPDNMGSIQPNIVRLVLSTGVSIIAALFVFYHIKWVKSMEPAGRSTT